MRDCQNLHRDRLSDWLAIGYTAMTITTTTTTPTTTTPNTPTTPTTTTPPTPTTPTTPIPTPTPTPAPTNGITVSFPDRFRTVSGPFPDRAIFFSAQI